MNAFLKGMSKTLDFVPKAPSYEEVTGFKDDSEAIASDFNAVIDNLEQKGYKVDSIKDLNKYLNNLRLGKDK